MQESLDSLVVLLTVNMTEPSTVWLVEAFADCAVQVQHSWSRRVSRQPE